MKKIVVIGGGTGLSSMLKGMKRLEDVDLTAIVTVADDGGSTGRIRDIYNVPAVGDIRHVLCAMADEEDEGFYDDDYLDDENQYPNDMSVSGYDIQEDDTLD